jgi:hypothetical protein
MTIINNYHSNKITDEDIKRFFSDNNMDISNRQLTITRDVSGHVKKVDVDYAMTKEQFNLFISEIFETDHTMEIIGSLTLSGDFYSDIDLSLSKNKKHIRLVVELLVPNFVYFEIIFNDDTSSENYSVDGTSSKLPFYHRNYRKSTNDDDFVYGVVDISNSQNSEKIGNLQFDENTEEDKKVEKDFTWNNSTDYIRKITIRPRDETRFVIGKGTKFTLYGWD